MTREPSPKPEYDPSLDRLSPRYDDAKERGWIEAASKGETEPKREQRQERK